MRAVVAACACACALDAFAQRYDVVGQCRSGVPNGAYELKTGDGGVRAVGAFSQGRMTGTFIFWRGGGARLAVVPLDNDARNGTVALWYTTPEGRKEAGHKLEAPYVDDKLHGVKRSWYANGARRTELRYEHGRLVAARAWSESGAPLPDAEVRRLAASDAEADERTYASLVALVRQHLPVCDSESTG